MKKRTCVCIILVIISLMLSSCSQVIAFLTYDGTLIYNNTIYTPVPSGDWWMINDNYTEVTVSIGDAKEPAKLYDDPEEIFILHEAFPGECLYFRSDITLPSYEDENSVEKILIDYYDEEKEDIAIYGDDMRSILSDMKSYDENELKDNTTDCLGQVYICFNDFPAYFSYGYLIKTRDGKYGIYRFSEQPDEEQGFIEELFSNPFGDRYAPLSNQDLFK